MNQCLYMKRINTYSQALFMCMYVPKNFVCMYVCMYDHSKYFNFNDYHKNKLFSNCLQSAAIPFKAKSKIPF